MKLLTKFNLILILLFGLCGLVIAEVAYNFLISNARREVLEEAELMMAERKVGSRLHRRRGGSPAAAEAAKQDTFAPETVPAFSALATFKHVHDQVP